MKVKRRDGFYEVTGNGRLFQIERDLSAGGWTIQEWFGPVVGWSEFVDRFGTFREAKEEAAFRLSLSEES